MITKTQEISSMAYGKYPGSRTLEDHINNGIVILDKPSGPTSHQVTAWVRDMFNLKKAGHSGTLDPKVTGLLVITLGNSTKIMPALMGLEKEYVGILQLHKDVSEDEIRATFEKFKGEIVQRPPKKSAVKRVARKREIYELEILEIDGRHVLFRTLCEAGTYIRKLCSDIGDLLGGGHMKELRRTKAGPYSESDICTLQNLKDALAVKEEDETLLRTLIRPVETGVEHTGKIIVKDSAVDAICNGAPVSIGGVMRLDDEIVKDETVSIFTGKGELIGIGISQMTSDEMLREKSGIAIKTDRILMDRRTYPDTWRKVK